jgi:hypothetical protein
MNPLKKRRQYFLPYISEIILIIIGILCLFYSSYKARFAELHISISFLNFPIFIGETALAICILLLLIRQIILRAKRNKDEPSLDSHRSYIFRILLVSFFVFVLIKALVGYIKWGPLALRNAALFYYAFFAVLTYYAFNLKFFKAKLIRYTLLALFLSIIFIAFPKVSIFYYFNYSIFGVLLLPYIKSKALRYLFFILILYFSWVHITSCTQGRDVLVSTVCACLFIFLIFGIYFLNLKLRYKVIALSVIAVFMSLAVLKKGDRNSFKSLFGLKEYITRYKMRIEAIESKKDFSFSALPVRLYHPESEVKDFYNAVTPSVSENISETKKVIEKPKLLVEKSISPVPEPKPLVEYREIDNKTFVSLPEGIDKEEFTNALINYVSQKNSKEATSDIISVDKPEQLTATVSDNAKPAAQTQEDSSITAVDKNQTPDSISTGKTQEVVPEPKPLVEYREIDNKTFVSLPERIDKEEIDSFIINSLTISKSKTEEISQPKAQESYRTVGGARDSAIWRLLIWKDMLEELFKTKSILGLDFGRPFRSRSIECLRLSSGGWVGWIEPHNSYVHILYRAGAIGVLFILTIWGLFFKMLITFVRNRNNKGVFLSSTLLYWLIIPNFSVILELPYFAIPFWSLWGVIYGYYVKTKHNVV